MHLHYDGLRIQIRLIPLHLSTVQFLRHGTKCANSTLAIVPFDLQVLTSSYEMTTARVLSMTIVTLGVTWLSEYSGVTLVPGQTAPPVTVRETAAMAH